MTSDDAAVGLANLLPARHVLLFVGYIPVEPDDALRTGACLGEDSNDIRKGLARLLDEVVAFELLIGIPSDLTTDKDCLA